MRSCLAAPDVGADGQIAGALGIAELTIRYTLTELASMFRSTVLQATVEALEN